MNGRGQFKGSLSPIIALFHRLDLEKPQRAEIEDVFSD